jgi:hypothetical protein
LKLRLDETQVLAAMPAEMAATFQAGGKPTFAETLDAVHVTRETGMPLADECSSRIPLGKEIGFMEGQADR